MDAHSLSMKLGTDLIHVVLKQKCNFQSGKQSSNKTGLSKQVHFTACEYYNSECSKLTNRSCLVFLQDPALLSFLRWNTSPHRTPIKCQPMTAMMLRVPSGSHSSCFCSLCIISKCCYYRYFNISKVQFSPLKAKGLELD